MMKKMIFILFIFSVFFHCQKQENMEKKEKDNALWESFILVEKNKENPSFYYDLREKLEKTQDNQTVRIILEKMQNTYFNSLYLFAGTNFFYINRWHDGWSMGKAAWIVYFSEKEKEEREIEFFQYMPPSVLPLRVRIILNGQESHLKLKENFRNLKVSISLQKGLNWIYLEGEKTFVPKKVGINEDTRELGINFQFNVEKEDQLYMIRREYLAKMVHITNLVNTMLCQPDKIDYAVLRSQIILLDGVSGLNFLLQFFNLPQFDIKKFFNSQKILFISRAEDGAILGKNSAVFFYLEKEKTVKLEFYSEKIPGSLLPLSLKIKTAKQGKSYIIETYENLLVPVTLQKGVNWMLIETNKTMIYQQREIGGFYSILDK